jgi:hypothetical protein
MKKLFLVLVILLVPVLCNAGQYFNKGACPPNYCNEYPQFKVTWFGPDGIHMWDRVCNLQSWDNGAWWTFCVDNKTIVVVGNITAEELK